MQLFVLALQPAPSRVYITSAEHKTFQMQEASYMRPPVAHSWAGCRGTGKGFGRDVAPHHDAKDDDGRSQVGDVVNGLVLELLAKVGKESGDLLQLEGRRVLLNLPVIQHTLS